MMPMDTGVQPGRFCAPVVEQCCKIACAAEAGCTTAPSTRLREAVAAAMGFVYDKRGQMLDKDPASLTALELKSLKGQCIAKVRKPKEGGSAVTPTESQQECIDQATRWRALIDIEIGSRKLIVAINDGGVSEDVQ